MRIQCKVLSYPPLFSGPDGMSTATPSALESEAVHLQFSLPVQFPLLALLSSLLTPPPSLRLVHKVIFKKNLRFLFLLMFSLTGRTLCGVSVFASHTAVGELSSPVSGGGEMKCGELALSGDPPPTAERLPLSLLCFLVDCKGGQTAWLGERRDSCPGWGGVREGLQARSSPGVRGTWDGVGQGVEGRLSPGPQAVDEHSGHQGPLQLGMGRGRSPVHAAVHGGSGRRCSSAVHAAQQAWVVEIRRRKHPLQCRVIPRLSQQLQAHRGLPFPLGPEKITDVRAPRG